MISQSKSNPDQFVVAEVTGFARDPQAALVNIRNVHMQERSGAAGVTGFAKDQKPALVNIRDVKKFPNIKNEIVF